MATAQYAGVWNLGLEIGDFGQNKTENKRLAAGELDYGAQVNLLGFGLHLNCDAFATSGRLRSRYVRMNIPGCKDRVFSRTSETRPKSS